MNTEKTISENVEMLIHIFKNHPENRVALVKDYVGVGEEDCNVLYGLFLHDGFKQYKQKKETKRTALEIELLRGIGVSVSKKDLSVAVPYGTKLNGAALKSLDKLKSFGYTVIYATHKKEKHGDDK